jgi:hypothetical protein
MTITIFLFIIRKDSKKISHPHPHHQIRSAPTTLNQISLYSRYCKLQGNSLFAAILPQRSQQNFFSCVAILPPIYRDNLPRRGKIAAKFFSRPRNFTTYLQRIYRVVPHIYNIFSAYLLRIDSVFIADLLHIHYVFTTYLPRIGRTFTAPLPRIYNIFTSHLPHIYRRLTPYCDSYLPLIYYIVVKN